MKKQITMLLLCLSILALPGCAAKPEPSAPPQAERSAPAESAAQSVSAQSAASEPSEAQPFRYEHDPRLNPSAMEDIVEDESAVYGFRPNETGSLKQYAGMDWSDPDAVAQGREQRIAYHDSFSEMYDLLSNLRAENADIEEIARSVSALRNELRIRSYEGDPKGLEEMKARNLEEYGHEEGPLPDELYEKYGSWEAVLEKAFSVNSGMDACLGLYDEYYELYVMAGQVGD